MNKSLRLSEKWFHRGLWLVAFLFAWFLTGLGSTVVGDLPQVEQSQSLDDFMDPQRTPALRAAIKAAENTADEAPVRSPDAWKSPSIDTPPETTRRNS